MQLVQNWNQSWKWISVQCTAAITALTVTWETVLPADFKTGVVMHCYHWLVVVLGIAATFGRLIQQQAPDTQSAPK